MCGKNELQDILSTLVSDCMSLFGKKLVDVRLYGSYARGDQSEYSDIDVMILLDMNDIDARNYLSHVCRIASDISLAHNGIDLAPHICSISRYNKMKDFPGFHNNVMVEGVSMYAG